MDEYVVVLTFPAPATVAAVEVAHQVVDDLAGRGLSPAVATPGGLVEVTVSLVAPGAASAVERALAAVREHARLTEEPVAVRAVTAAVFDAA